VERFRENQYSYIFAFYNEGQLRQEFLDPFFDVSLALGLWGIRRENDMNWYLTVLKKYAVFSGRAQRAEYWYFVLFNLIFSFVLGAVDGVLGTTTATGVQILRLIYTLAVMIPSVAVGVRRLHDIGRSGWWLLLVLVPVIGLIALTVFFVFDSQPEANEYGPNPKGVEA
jgi:uncharacterized membrane protein YhaH (DUF805 family)